MRSGAPRLGALKPRGTGLLALAVIPATPRSSLVVAGPASCVAEDGEDGEGEAADTLCDLPVVGAASPKAERMRRRKHHDAGSAPPASHAGGRWCSRWRHSTIHAAGATMATEECDRIMVAVGRTREECARVAHAWKISYDDAMALIVDVEAAQDGGSAMRKAECLLR